MFVDESQNPDVDTPTLPPVMSPPPPAAILPKLEGPIFNEAIQRLRDGKSGMIFVHEKTQDGSVNATNIVFVKRIGDNITATGWVGRDWDKPGTVSYGASLAWEFD